MWACRADICVAWPCGVALCAPIALAIDAARQVFLCALSTYLGMQEHVLADFVEKLLPTSPELWAHCCSHGASREQLGRVVHLTLHEDVVHF